MSLPSKEILEGIRDLIHEITGFKENDENFEICERYCVSHVVHHTYPFVNKTTVKNSINSYVSRLYSHGYFKVSKELNTQVNSFLSYEKLFEKNPQYDIHWCLLSLLSSLSSNLTSVKELPELLPIEDEEKKSDNFDWKEYLTSGLPPLPQLSSDTEESSQDDEDEENESTNDEIIISQTESSKINMCENKVQVIFDNKNMFNNENAAIRKQRVEEFLNSRRTERGIENDFKLRGNVTETLNELLSKEGITRKTQLISEFEMMENILFQFQTGERLLLRKGLINPCLTSLTEESLGSYLDSIEPYFNMIRCFKDFDRQITEARYPQKFLEDNINTSDKSQTTFESVPKRTKKIPNVLYMYNAMLKAALEPFQNEIMNIVENLGNYTLIQMEKKLQPYYSDIMSLFSIHKKATSNWHDNPNWLTSVRILSVLYNAIMDATSLKMSFVFLNFFLNCFQVYLNIIDDSVTFLDLIDPNNEFIVARSQPVSNSVNGCSEYKIQLFEKEIENVGVKKIKILDFISQKMLHVGQSLEILKRLNRFASNETLENFKESSYQQLIKAIQKEVDAVKKVDVLVKKNYEHSKPKSLFTMKSVGVTWKTDYHGRGDSLEVDSLFLKVLKEEEEKEKSKEIIQIAEENKSHSHCEKLINIRNPFFKMAFDGLGMNQVEKQLEKAKERQKQVSGFEALMVIKQPKEDKIGIYPFHKIITESFQIILENRVSNACALVKDIVLKEFDLVTHLSMLRSILLFNDSHLIQPFTWALFTEPAIWESSYLLSFHLNECVRNLYKNHMNSLSVIITRNGIAKPDSILHVIDSITVKYEVQWPLTLIITPKTMELYNELFRLSLKLKWAHWTLCGLSFQGSMYKTFELVTFHTERDLHFDWARDIDSNEKNLCTFSENNENRSISKSSRHRLQILKFWLLSALGRINNYFLAQMTPPIVDFSSCNDLKDIIKGHSEFVEKISYNCLIGKKSPKGRKLIFETLIPLCCDLFLLYSNFNDSKLLLIEKSFKMCHPLLSDLLSSLEK